jgi:threonylcarbamoyladenosine tRNA methylthiotransferase MtaB
MTVEIVTFGCRLNAFESEAIRRRAAEAGLENAIIFNTCAVTSEAERQARQAIRRARRRNPTARLIVTGCAAQISPDRYAAMDEVDQVVGNREKFSVAVYAPGAQRTSVGPRALMRDTTAPAVEGFEGKVRAYLAVQHGCDHSCTFCIIPEGRGPSRSVPLGEIVRQARALVAAGSRELVLTGVDIASFGRDLPERPSLGGMCRALLALVPDLPRLRLSSLDPAAIDDELWALLAAEERLMPHLHLSLQAGSDMVLKRMKRRHLRQPALDLCRRAHALRPDVALGADLIAGFPTEDEAMFAETLAFVRDAPLDYLHVFPFSARPGTPAARMPQVPRDVIRARAARLREAGATSLARGLAARVGSTARVLVERPGFGRSEHYAPVRLSPDIAPGRIASLPIVASAPDALIAAVP